MDLEELTKTQIVLLTLLITFVTSIATGIVTVSLMDQAPPAVTKTINRVVERTIERVVPADIKGDKETIIVEKTVVVNESDIVTESIENNKNKIVRLYLESEVTTTGTEEEDNIVTTEEVLSGSFVGLGLLISSDGLIITGRDVARSALSLKALTSNGKIYTTEIANTDVEFETGLLRIVPEEGEEINLPTVKLMGEDGIKLGQTIISIGGKKRTSVEMGIISDLIYEDIKISVVDGEEGEIKTITILGQIDTSISSRSFGGGPILNIFGEVIGIKTSTGVSAGGLYTPIHVIQSQINSYTESRVVAVEDTETTDELE